MSATAIGGTTGFAGGGQQGDPGANGLNTATLFLFRRTVTDVAPDTISINTEYTYSTATLIDPVTGNDGITNAIDGWFRRIPEGVTGEYLWAISTNIADATDTEIISAGDWSTVSLFSSPGEDGNSVQIKYSNATGDLPPGNPNTNPLAWQFSSDFEQTEINTDTLRYDQQDLDFVNPRRFNFRTGSLATDSIILNEWPSTGTVFIRLDTDLDPSTFFSYFGVTNAATVPNSSVPPMPVRLVMTDGTNFGSYNVMNVAIDSSDQVIQISTEMETVFGAPVQLNDYTWSIIRDTGVASPNPARWIAERVGDMGEWNVSRWGRGDDAVVSRVDVRRLPSGMSVADTVAAYDAGTLDFATFRTSDSGTQFRNDSGEDKALISTVSVAGEDATDATHLLYTYSWTKNGSAFSGAIAGQNAMRRFIVINPDDIAEGGEDVFQCDVTNN